MRRRPAFNLSYAHEVFEPGLRKTFPVLPDLPHAIREVLARLDGACVRPSPTERLEALRQLTEDEASQLDVARSSV